MIAIEIKQLLRQGAGVQPEHATVARLEVNGRALKVVEGDQGWYLLTETVLNHPDTGEDLTFESDPELWALHLPEAFRTPDTVVTAALVESTVGKRSRRRAHALSN